MLIILAHVSVHTSVLFSKYLKTKQTSLKIMIATSETLGLAKGIINDTILSRIRTYYFSGGLMANFSLLSADLDGAETHQCTI